MNNFCTKGIDHVKYIATAQQFKRTVTAGRFFVTNIDGILSILKRLNNRKYVKQNTLESLTAHQNKSLIKIIL